MCGDLPGRRVWVALDMKIEPTSRPVDGHLPARVLSPQLRVAIDWVDVEFANLRAGFRWSADQQDLETATAIAAHSATFCYHLQRSEPIGWAEEVLPAAIEADLAYLPRLYYGASTCMFTGRPEEAVAYLERAIELEAIPFS